MTIQTERPSHPSPNDALSVDVYNFAANELTQELRPQTTRHLVLAPDILKRFIALEQLRLDIMGHPLAHNFTARVEKNLENFRPGEYMIAPSPPTALPLALQIGEIADEAQLSSGAITVACQVTLRPAPEAALLFDGILPGVPNYVGNKGRECKIPAPYSLPIRQIGNVTVGTERVRDWLVANRHDRTQFATVSNLERFGIE